jgi:hypothetical protein
MSVVLAQAGTQWAALDLGPGPRQGDECCSAVSET